MATDSLSAEDKEFLAQCEEEFKERYTEKDEEFMKVYNAEPPTPPLIESWWGSQNSGRRNDQRFNRRYNPYDRRNRDGDRRSRYDNEHENDNRGYGYRNRRYNN